jgi:tRNA-specific 2-thiouridylase
MHATKTKIAVAMSGGVDSTVAAAQLQEQGHEVIGLWMHLRGEGPPEADASFRAAQQAAEGMGIPLVPVDLRSPFQAEVVNPFLREYLAGRTPNPCARCNPRIKFGALLEKALEMGAERFATGHYARVAHDPAQGRFVLLRGIDKGKDQSYFLWGLDQGQLARCSFPNGELTKEEVRGMAQGMGLAVAERGESQEICFIPRGDYRSFLRSRLTDDRRAEGAIVDKAGRIKGRHKGIFGFTIGQRRGIGIPAPRPYYVLRIEPDAGRVVIGEKEDLLAARLVAQGMHWVSPPPPQELFKAMGQIRYRHAAAPCQVEVRAGGEAAVCFDERQEAITPGQALVLFHDDCVLGGGWIKEVSDG